MSTTLIALLILVGLVLFTSIYWQLVLVLWCLVDCLSSPTRSNKAKIIWSLFLILFWGLSNLIYALVSTESKKLKNHTLTTFILFFLFSGASLGLVFTNATLMEEIKQKLESLNPDALTQTPSLLEEAGLPPEPEAVLDESQLDFINALGRASRTKDRAALKKLYDPASLTCINKETQHYADKEFKKVLSQPVDKDQKITFNPQVSSLYTGDHIPVTPTHSLEYSYKTPIKVGFSTLPVIKKDSTWNLVYPCPDPQIIKQEGEYKKRVLAMEKKKIKPIPKGVRGFFSANGVKTKFKSVMAFWEKEESKLTIEFFQKKLTSKEWNHVKKVGQERAPLPSHLRSNLTAVLNFKGSPQGAKLSHVDAYTLNITSNKGTTSTSIYITPGQRDQEKVYGFRGPLQNGKRIKGMFLGNRKVKQKDKDIVYNWNFSFNTVVHSAKQDPDRKD